MDFCLANDKYRATTRATYIDDPADASIQVTAIPANLPTFVTLGWQTEFETVFKVEGTSGTNSSNYALTGLTKIKGFDGNLPEGLAVNCLNNEEFFNQYSDAINDLTQDVADALAAVDAITAEINALSGDIVGTTDTQTLTNKRITRRVVAAADATSITPNSDTSDMVTQANTQSGGTLTINAPTGTPTNGQGLILRIKSTNGQTYSFNGAFDDGQLTLPASHGGSSKTDYLGFLYNSTSTKWELVALVQAVG